MPFFGEKHRKSLGERRVIDDVFVKNWIAGLMQGASALSQKERETLFRCCAERCARSAPLALYQQASRKAGENIPAFFSLLGENEGIRTKQILPGKQYEIVYSACGCDWHSGGYTDSQMLCECSRQSILYCLEQALPRLRCSVIRKQSLLAGGDCCRFLVKIEGKNRVCRERRCLRD